MLKKNKLPEANCNRKESWMDTERLLLQTRNKSSNKLIMNLQVLFGFLTSWLHEKEGKKELL